MTGPTIWSPSGKGPGRVPSSGAFTTLTRTTDVLRQGWGWGLAIVHSFDFVLNVFYPEPRIGGDVIEEAPASLLVAQLTDDLRQVRTKVVRVTTDFDAAPRNTENAYLRLYLLSHRLVRPHGINLDDIFGQLPNNAWTSCGPVHVEDVTHICTALRGRGEILQVFSVDKFSRMTNHVTPAGVRVRDADRVRLGAYLASGTTVMHGGFVSLNTGTLGVSMVEGHVFTGVVVSDDSDIGGGISIMDTLPGGGRGVINTGERCLLGTESDIGISLGDDCVVEAGLYVTAGTKAELPGDHVIKVRELSGTPSLLFLRDSQSERVVAGPRRGGTVEPSDELHTN